MTRNISYEVREQSSGRLLNICHGAFTIKASHEKEFYKKLYERLSMKHPSLCVKIIK
jgi:hypothetical protein